MYDVLDSHVQAEDEIRQCAKKFPERVCEIICCTRLPYLSSLHLTFSVIYSDLQVGDDTVTRSFLKKVEKHTPYLKEMKECHADLQGKAALLHEGQDALDILAECVLEGDGAFEHCKLKDTAFKIGNRFDTGKSCCLSAQCCRTATRLPLLTSFYSAKQIVIS